MGTKRTFAAAVLERRSGLASEASRWWFALVRLLTPARPLTAKRLKPRRHGSSQPKTPFARSYAAPSTMADPKKAATPLWMNAPNLLRL